MATHCVRLGFKYIPSKPIQFVKFLAHDLLTYDASTSPCTFENIELISEHKALNYKYDVMLAYQQDRNMGTIYLGYWNDGFVKEK